MELNEQPFAPTLAKKLGDVPHVSGLLRRIVFNITKVLQDSSGVMAFRVSSKYRQFLKNKLKMG